MESGPEMSTPATPATLREMDLQLKRVGDETIRYGKWRRKIELHTLAKKTYQSDKPSEEGEWWRLCGSRPETPGTPSCTLPIIVARLTARVPMGGARFNQYKTIEEEGFLVKEKLAIWVKKWIMYSKAAADDFAHLLVAAPKAVYKFPNYEDYVPIQVMENYEQFIDEFTNKHR